MTFIKNTSHLSFFLIFTFLSGPLVAMKEEDQNIQSFVLAKKDEHLPTQKEFENNMGFPEKTLILYKQISSLNEMVEKLQQKMNPLIQENENLNNEIRELKEKIKPFKPLKAVLKHQPSEWELYTNVIWTPVPFNIFEGDDALKGENVSMVEIPENGVYSLLAHTCWKARGNESAVYTAIARNDPGNFIGHYDYYPIFALHSTLITLTRVTRLSKGDKVMVSIIGSPNAEYWLGEFQFNIEKIN